MQDISQHLMMAGNVARYHTTGGPIQQTTGQHSWGVAMIILALHPNPSLGLVRAALEHDAAEFIVGDLPSPAKRKSPVLRDLLEGIENDTMISLGMQGHVHLSSADRAWLHWADVAEAMLWGRHLWYSFGFGTYRFVMRRAAEWLVDMGHPPMPSEATAEQWARLQSFVDVIKGCRNE